MPTTITAGPTKTAPVIALAAAALLLFAGCSGGPATVPSDSASSASEGDGSDGSSQPSVDGAWIVAEPDGIDGDVVGIHGDEVIYIRTLWRDDAEEERPACASTKAAIEDIEAGSVDHGARSGDEDAVYQVQSVGELSDSPAYVTLDEDNGSDRTGEEPGMGDFTYLGDSIKLENTFGTSSYGDATLVPVSSDLGKSLVADACESN
ncbi:Uncharacterised protein [Mycobacteroides abscessus subsp. bolletii]|nr:Uncharacterised protein [Mycobacteroides abscessus subsp. bolletii]